VTRRLGDDIMAPLTDLNRKERTTVVMVTHDQQKAYQTNRIVRLFDGRQVN
jgi:putative ABC transport system ATP-binding protein